MRFQPLFLFLHIAGAVVWVGGMFFAYVCLRPVVALLFEPPQRLRLWRNVFSRFFLWVWLALALLVVSGLLMFGLVKAALHVHLMLASGLVMAGVFVYIVAGPFARLDQAVNGEDWKAGGAALNRIRQCVGFNLSLGMFTIAVATLGHWLL